MDAQAGRPLEGGTRRDLELGTFRPLEPGTGDLRHPEADHPGRLDLALSGTLLLRVFGSLEFLLGSGHPQKVAPGRLERLVSWVLEQVTPGCPEEVCSGRPKRLAHGNPQLVGSGDLEREVSWPLETTGYLLVSLLWTLELVGPLALRTQLPASLTMLVVVLVAFLGQPDVAVLQEKVRK